VINVIDQVATTRALASGFSEGNPVMASLISANPSVAAFLKIAIVLAVTVTVWVLRREKHALEVAVFAASVFAVVLAIQTWGLLFYY
jgi:Domain of unknown function (DUF5658)